MTFQINHICDGIIWHQSEITQIISSHTIPMPFTGATIAPVVVVVVSVHKCFREVIKKTVKKQSAD